MATEGYGLPESVADTFSLLAGRGVIGAEHAQRLRRTVGFRNIAVYEYQTLDPAIVEAIVTRHLGDLRELAARVVQRFTP